MWLMDYSVVYFSCHQSHLLLQLIVRVFATGVLTWKGRCWSDFINNSMCCHYFPIDNEVDYCIANGAGAMD